MSDLDQLRREARELKSKITNDVNNEINQKKQNILNYYNNFKKTNIDKGNQVIKELENKINNLRNDYQLKIKEVDNDFANKMSELEKLQKNGMDKISKEKEMILKGINEKYNDIISTNQKNFDKSKKELVNEILNNKAKEIKKHQDAEQMIFDITNKKTNLIIETIKNSFKNNDNNALKIKLEQKRKEYVELTGKQPIPKLSNISLRRAIYMKKKRIEELKKMKKNPPKPVKAQKKEVKLDSSNERYMPYVENIVANITNDSQLSISGNGHSIDQICSRVIVVCRKIYNDPNITKIKGFKMCPRKCQVLAILRLVDELLNGTRKGTIGQVKTGEGKSFIIAVVAIILAQYGHKIDVVTPTVQLAKRDQMDQKMYYDLFGVSSGVLFNKKSDQEYEQNQNIQSPQNTEFTTEVFDSQIVYSTNSNFEFVYLHSLFARNPLRNRPYDIVIVDEVDNMLIDQASSPAMIASDIDVANAEDIFKAVFMLREYDVPTIISALKEVFPKYGDFDERGIAQLKEAAIISDNYMKDKDYVHKDGNVVIMDHTTGHIKIGSRWKGFIHEMIEIREGIKMKNPSNSYCLITQKTFFNLYKHITGVTGTIGDSHDIQILQKTYNVSTFDVPRNVPSKQIVNIVRRPTDLVGVFQYVNTEIEINKRKGRPVLVIFDFKKLVDIFVEKVRSDVRIIDGTVPSIDLDSINHAGEPGAVTIATNAAGRGIDIKLTKEAIANGGLHVIIPIMPRNSRILEQAKGRSARQGQPGSVSLYVNYEFDRFYRSAEFDEKYDVLFSIQTMFVKYVRQSYPYAFGYEKTVKISPPPRPFKADPNFVFKSMGSIISRICCGNTKPDKEIANFIYDMIISAWSTFFTDLSENDELLSDRAKALDAYNDFIGCLSRWIAPNHDSPQKALIDINKSAEAVGPDFFEFIDEISKCILKATGSLLNTITFGLLGEVMKNRVVQGSVLVIGGVLAIAGIVMAGIPTGGIGWVVGGAQLGFGALSIFDGIQEIQHGINGDDEDTFNPLKEVTGHKLDNFIDLADLAVGFAPYEGTRGVARAAENAAKVEKAKGALKDIMETNKLTDAEAATITGGLRTPLPQVEVKEKILEATGGLPVNKATKERLCKIFGKELEEQGKKIVGNEMRRILEDVEKGEKVKNVYDAVDDAFNYAGVASTALNVDN